MTKAPQQKFQQRRENSKGEKLNLHQRAHFDHFDHFFFLPDDQIKRGTLLSCSIPLTSCRITVDNAKNINYNPESIRQEF